MRVYRICRSAFAESFDGEGARLYGGRWNPKGVRMVYAASSLSLATLEAFVHLSPRTVPRDFVYVAVDIPDDLAVEQWPADGLPSNWSESPAPEELQTRGRRWIERGSSAVLLVPSAVVPIERNVLINPMHADAGRISRQPPARFLFDVRMIQRLSS